MPPSESSRAGKPAPAPSSLRRLLFTLARLGVGIAILIYLAKSHLINFRDLGRLFLTAWPITVAAFSLLMLHVALISWRLCVLFRPQGLRLSFWTSMRLALIGLFFEMFTPGAAGGTMAKVFYATRENEGRRTQVGTVVVFDRAVGIFSLLSLPIIFAPFFLGLIARVHVLRVILITYASIMALLVVVLLASLWREWEEPHMAGHPHRYAALNAVERVLGTIGAYRRSPKTLWSAFGLSLLANLSIIGVIALGVLVVNPPSVAWRLSLIVPIGQLVNSLPITPGGLGVGEVAFNTLFRLSGLRGGAEAVLCWRVWSALIGGIGLIFYLRGMERKVVEPEAPSDQAPITQMGRSRRSGGTRSVGVRLSRTAAAIRDRAQARTKQAGRALSATICQSLAAPARTGEV